MHHVIIITTVVHARLTLNSHPSAASHTHSTYLIMAELIPFFGEEDKDWILGKTALSVYKWASNM